MKKILLFSLLVLFSCDLKKDTLPNVIVILVDDLGYADLGFTGSNEISTPNIDGLAENGVVFTDGYGDSVSITEPKKWHWFIEGSWGMEQAKYLADKKCSFYPMKDFK